MSSQRRGWLRFSVVLAAVALLAISYFRDRNGAKRVLAEPTQDPNAIWSLGALDNSADEFAPGSAAELTYDCETSSPSKDWRQRQESADKEPTVYKIRFRLDHAPGSPLVLAVDGFFVGMAPRAAVLNVNGKRGYFRIHPKAAPDLDERQANTITHSGESLRMPVDASFFHSGENEIGISYLGEGGSIYYDALSLRKPEKPVPEMSATVEPTIFFHMHGEQLKEDTEVVLNHQLPLGATTVALKIGAARATGKDESDGYDFGERLVRLEAPAVSQPAPYELRVTSGGKTATYHGEFRPEKRWRIFAGLKIHNDIGYTDLQPHVQELDNRNTDDVIDIISKFPFYKFNFETGWLIDDYVHSRVPSRVRKLMALAAADKIAINSIYLNLLTGLCTGEELYRSIYFTKSLQRKYGFPMKFASLTDAPSHTWFIPTLLSDVGIPGFANGSNQTRAPLLQNSHLNEDSPFYWEGPDGRRVISWFARSYLQLYRLVGDQPSLDRLRRTIPQFLARYRRGNYPVDAVLLFGLYTDNANIRGGDAEILKKWNEAYAFPKLIPATDADYYAYLEKHFAGKLPTFRGDAGSYWEDGAGSSAAETAINRDSQRMLPVAEMAASWATLMHPAELYPAPEFNDAWKNLLFYDEHTWGAHNSVSQPDRRFVTDQWEFKRAYALRAHWAAKDLLYRSLNRLVQNISIQGPTMFVFNPDLWPRTGIVQLELQKGRELFDLKTGQAVPVDIVSQREGYRVLRILATSVPGLGYQAYGVRQVKPSEEATPAPVRTPWLIETRYYRISFDPRTGAIAHLYDKELGRDLVDQSAPYKLNELLYVSGGENSSILQDLAILKPPELKVTGQEGARVVENVRTPFGRRIRIQAEARNVPSIDTEVDIYDDVKRIDITNRLVKKEVRAKEAVYFAFPFAVSPPELAYEVQNAWIHPNTDQLPGADRDWFTTQNLVIARDAGATIAWSTPDAPLITLTDINRGEWLKHLDVKNGHVFSYAMNNYWFTNYRAEQGGNLTFRYHITSDRKLSNADLARFDAETRSPLVGYGYYNTGNVRLQPGPRRMPLTEGSFLSVDAANAQVTAFKQAEDGRGYILRLRETAGQKGVARVHSPVFPLGRAYLCDGVEDNRSPLPVNRGTVEVPLKPHEFSTVRLLMAPGAPNQTPAGGF